MINILEYGLSEVKRDIYNYENKINKVLLGYSSGGKEIIAYFRGLPEEGYFAIFGNIHGSYEYGSYETSIYLKDFLSNTDKKGWFIIPSLNPDGLDYFLKNGKTSSYYINGRSNLNNVDINRNFCTNNFSLASYYKKGQKFLTGISGCNGELETKVILRTLEKYKFNSIISLHSQGKIFYIPDNSIDDERVLDLGYKLKDILPDYDFDPYYKNPEEKKEKIKAYEMDEGGIGLYTGTMETYIYEKYDIPVVLIELSIHGKVEKRLKNIIKYLR